MLSRSLTVGAFLLVLCLSMAAAAEAPAQADFQPGVAEGPAPWTDKAFADAPGDFHFAIMSDRTGGLREGVFERGVEKVNLLMPAFVMCVGDLVEGYTDDAAEVKTQRDDIDAVVGRLRMPFFRAAGNHDNLTDALSADWKARYGRLHYSFVYRNCLFVVLDSQDNAAQPEYKSGLSAQQVSFVKQALADNAAVRWTFVFLHQPLWDREAYGAMGTRWDEVEAMLASRPHTVFAGHWHQYARYKVNGRDYYILATTGGASQLAGPERGEMDHIMWVTMTDGGPVVAPVLLDGILSPGVSTSESVSFYDNFVSRSPLTAQPIAPAAGAAASIESALEVRNPFTVPVYVKAAFKPVEGVTFSPAVIEKTVAPNSSEKLAYKLELAPAAGALDVFSLDWSTRATLSDGRELAGSGSQPIFIEALRAIRRRASPVSVDGDLSEWDSLPFSCVTPGDVAETRGLWTGPDDASFRFNVAYDDEYVYVAVEALDDRLVVDGEHNPRQEDGLSLFVNPRDRSTWSAGGPGSSPILVLSPGAAAAEAQIADLPEGAKAADVITPKGHNAEFAIPVSVLDAAAGKPWDTLRINIRQHDLDASDYSCVFVSWRPRWLGPQDSANTGVFVKE